MDELRCGELRERERQRQRERETHTPKEESKEIKMSCTQYHGKICYPIYNVSW